VKEEVFREVSDKEHPCEMWQLRVSLDIEIREVALRLEFQTAAALGVERLWSGASQVLTDNRRSMKSARLVQWLRLRLNLHVLSDEEMLLRPGITLCMSEQAFDDVDNELMNMEDGDLVKALRKTTRC
jgi:hypothetical protein